MSQNLAISKLLIQPPRDKYAEDADEIRRKTDAEMDLHDPQIQGDVLYMEDLIGLRQERHETDKVRTAEHLSQDAADQSTGG